MGDKFKNIKNSTIVNRTSNIIPARNNIEQSDNDKMESSHSEIPTIWYKKPLGIIILAVISIVIGKIIINKLGL